MGAKEDLAPLVDQVIGGMSSNEFTTFAFLVAFSRVQEKAYVKALYENIDHPAGPFGAVKAILESLLDASPRANKLRDGARDMDYFGLPSTTILWQRKT